VTSWDRSGGVAVNHAGAQARMAVKRAPQAHVAGPRETARTQAPIEGARAGGAARWANCHLIGISGGTAARSGEILAGDSSGAISTAKITSAGLSMSLSSETAA
jgi:hypothetical protein